MKYKCIRQFKILELSDKKRWIQFDYGEILEQKRFEFGLENRHIHKNIVEYYKDHFRKMP